jgi:hypothetical protein
VNNPPKITWEYQTQDYGKWVRDSQAVVNKSYPEPVYVTDEAMIDEVLERTEDKDFLREIVAWLKHDAPKKLRPALSEIHGIRQKPIKYEWLCELVYNLNFRASERIEHRMILGQTNEWTRKYFKDFPPRGKE